LISHKRTDPGHGRIGETSGERKSFLVLFFKKVRISYTAWEKQMATIAVILLGTLLAWFTDGLFFDLLVHRFYARAPEMWRPGGRARIAASQAIGTLATAAAVILAIGVPGRPVLLALLIWSAGPLPATLQNLQWTRMHQAIGASHAMGWLARLLIATILTHWMVI
jgi:hypothetical protein